MRVLIDTSILVEAERRNFDLGLWIEQNEVEEIFICDAGIAEFLAGEPIKDEGKRKRFKEFWSTFVCKLPSLPLDRRICETAGALLLAARRNNRTIPLGDGLHGAAARSHDLHVLTADIKHFNDMGVTAMNPMQDQSPR
jgi:predicted nucleic acid-binding protein